MINFTKPPLTQKEKEKKAKEFLNFVDHTENIKITNIKKEPIRNIYLRAPESFWKDIKEIMSLTGLSMNAICLELLRPAIKRKLREIKNDML